MIWKNLIQLACISVLWCLIALPCWYHSSTLLTEAKRVGYKDLESFGGPPLEYFFRTKPTVSEWDTIETPKKFSINTMVLEHQRDGVWYLPHLHDRYSIGWNRTTAKPFLQRPVACNIRFFGVGLESTLQGFETGGTGYLTISFKGARGKQFWYGFDRNETNKVHCYYDTNKDRGSEFLDSPKTLGVAIYCPVGMDDEVGPHVFTSHMHQGLFCRPLAEHGAEVEVHLRPTAYREPPSGVLSKELEAEEVIGEIVTLPAEARAVEVKALLREGRAHAVCTVQTFKNQHSAAMLFMFIKYYQIMGWRYYRIIPSFTISIHRCERMCVV